MKIAIVIASSTSSLKVEKPAAHNCRFCSCPYFDTHPDTHTCDILHTFTHGYNTEPEKVKVPQTTKTRSLRHFLDGRGDGTLNSGFKSAFRQKNLANIPDEARNIAEISGRGDGT